MLINKYNVILSITIYSVLFPVFVLGGRYVYFFEIVLLSIIIGLVFFGQLRFKITIFIYLLSLLFFFAVIAFFFNAVYNSTSGLWSWRFILIFSGLSLILNNFNYIDIRQGVKNVVLIVSIVGIIQTVDGFLLDHMFGMNQFLSEFYPYPGEQSEKVLSKTGGFNLATNAMFQITSLIDGHTILAGNFLAVGSVAMFYWRSKKAFYLTFFATLLTFSRGSWLLMFVGLASVWASNVNFKNMFRFFNFHTLSNLLLISLVLSTFLLSTPFGEIVFARIINTLEAFNFIENVSNAPSDPRTTYIWPHFFDQMASNGISAWLIGIPGGFPVDSGHFHIIKTTGLLGWLLLSVFVISVFIYSARSKLVFSIIFAITVAMIFNPVHQGLRLLALLAFIVVAEKNYLRPSMHTD